MAGLKRRPAPVGVRTLGLTNNNRLTVLAYMLHQLRLRVGYAVVVWQYDGKKVSGALRRLPCTRSGDAPPISTAKARRPSGVFKAGP
jgi:hypothetical protein